jgi:hypothetical protein
MYSVRFTSVFHPRHPFSGSGEAHGHRSPLRRPVAALGGSAAVALLLVGTVFTPVASAATFVQLGAATPFAVLAYSEVTNVPTSAITGDMGLSPAAGTNYAGVSQAQVDGTIYTTNASGPAGYDDDPALLGTAKTNLSTAYTSATGQTPTTTFTTVDNQLGGKVLVPGVYAFGHAQTANIEGSPLILNGEGDANAVFIFQASSDLVTAPDSVVQLENGAQACNVFWTVGSSATLNTGSTFVGTIMAYASATLLTGATVQGRILAETGAVTLDANTITTPPTCNAGITTTTTTTAPTTSTTTPAGTTVGTGTGGTAAAGEAATTAASGSGGIAAGAATGTATDSPGSTVSTAVVPTGFPHTGLGGAAHSRYTTLIGLGVLALVGSGASAVVGVRRRRALLHSIDTHSQG